MADTQEFKPFKLRANKEYTEKLLSFGALESPKHNYVDEFGNYASFEDAEVYDPHTVFLTHVFEKVYLDEIPQEELHHPSNESRPFKIKNKTRSSIDRYITTTRMEISDRLSAWRADFVDEGNAEVFHQWPSLLGEDNNTDYDKVYLDEPSQNS